MDIKSVAVLGSGAGGSAVAVDLILKGFDVNLYEMPEYKENVSSIIERGGIKLEGEIGNSDCVKPTRITTDIGEAVRNADLIIVVMPGTAHGIIAERCAPYLTSEKILMLQPGRTGGALEFNSVLRRAGITDLIPIVEVATLAFVCRKTGPYKVTVDAKKNAVSAGIFPSRYTDLVFEKVRKVFPQFEPVENVLETSLNTVDPVVHAIPALTNIGRIEASGGNFNHYLEGITPSIATLMNELDKERLAISQAFGVRGLSTKEWLMKSYASQGNDLYQAIMNTKQYRNERAAESVDHRYFFDAVCSCLVPMESFARLLNVPTPLISATITLIRPFIRDEYWQRRRTLERLGLSGLDPRGIRSYVESGQMN